MKNRVLRIFLAVTVGLAVYAAILVPKTDFYRNWQTERRVKRFLSDYVDNVVNPAISQLVQRLEDLDMAVGLLRKGPTQEGMERAAEAWKEAEAALMHVMPVLFGPGVHFDYDKLIAAFPADTFLIDSLISDMAAGRVKITHKELRENYHFTMRGLHAAEYLLFRHGKPRNVAALSPHELDYLSIVTKNMVLESLDFYACWQGTENMPDPYRQELKREGFKAWPSYGWEFKHAGEPASRYLSQSAAMQEIYQNIVGTAEIICDEIKLGIDDPYESRTWFSHNAKNDLIEAVRGLQKAYTANDKGISPSDMTGFKNEILDKQIQIAFAYLIHYLEEVPTAPESNVPVPEGDRQLELRRALATCDMLLARLPVAGALVCMAPEGEPWGPYGM